MIAHSEGSPGDRSNADAPRRMGVGSARIAVTGLNPHAGEGELFGTEDQAIIAPAIARLVN